MGDEIIQKVVNALKRELPEVVRISALGSYPSVTFAPGTVHNEICLGTGPQNSFMMGKYRCLFRDDLIHWVVRKLMK